MSFSSNLHIRSYCDSDWVSFPTTHRSITGHRTMLSSSPTSPIYSKTKKQSVVARSSAEAEYRSLATLTYELQWLKLLFCDLSFPHPEPMTVLYNNQAVIHIIENSVFHEWTKHIELDCYFIRDKIQSGLLVPYYIWTSLQIADLFTKPPGKDPFHRHIGKLGVIDLHTLP